MLPDFLRQLHFEMILHDVIIFLLGGIIGFLLGKVF